jgi:hypothetical protein
MAIFVICTAFNMLAAAVCFWSTGFNKKTNLALMQFMEDQRKHDAENLAQLKLQAEQDKENIEKWYQVGRQIEQTVTKAGFKV